MALEKMVPGLSYANSVTEAMKIDWEVEKKILSTSLHAKEVARPAEIAVRLPKLQRVHATEVKVHERYFFVTAVDRCIHSAAHGSSAADNVSSLKPTVSTNASVSMATGLPDTATATGWTG